MRIKHPMIVIGLAGLFGTTPILNYVPEAVAANSNVEAALQSSSDLSLFYQALVSSGVLNELAEDEHYTVFAPTNDAFAGLTRTRYPCFYTGSCKPQTAAMLRNQIVAGHHDLPDLVSYGSGIETEGGRLLHIDEAFVRSYEVEDQPITGKVEAGLNVIYKVSGLIATPEELAALREEASPPLHPATVTTEKTVIEKSYTTTMPIPIPDGSSQSLGASPPVQTTIIRSYETE